jgi:hypothetical protein
MGILEELKKSIDDLTSAVDALRTSGYSAKESKTGTETKKAATKPAADDDDDLLDDEPKKPAAKSSGRKKVSHADLTAKVQPLTADPETKKKVRAVMDKFNLKRLADAKEEQYGPLWDAFDAIENDSGSGDDEDDDIL